MRICPVAHTWIIESLPLAPEPIVERWWQAGLEAGSLRVSVDPLLQIETVFRLRCLTQPVQLNRSACGDGARGG